MYIDWQLKRSISVKFIDLRFTCQMGLHQAPSRSQIVVALILLIVVRRWAQHAMNKRKLGVLLNKVPTDLPDFLLRHPTDRLAHGIR
jgi:hypothetical protein